MLLDLLIVCDENGPFADVGRVEGEADRQGQTAQPHFDAGGDHHIAAKDVLLLAGARIQVHPQPALGVGWHAGTGDVQFTFLTHYVAAHYFQEGSCQI